MSFRISYLGILVVFVVALILGCRPRDPDPRWDKFYDALHSEDFATAQELLDELNTSPFQDFYAKTMGEGNLALRLGHYDDALTAANGLISNTPSPRFYAFRARVYISMHRLDEAREDLVTALNEESDCDWYSLETWEKAEIYYNLWYIPMEQGRFKDAEEFANELRTKYPHESPAYYVSALLAFKDRDFTAASNALDCIRQNLSTHFNDETVDLIMSLHRAWIALEEGDADRALGIYYNIQPQDRTRSEYWIARARLEWHSGKMQQARLTSIEGLLRIGADEILDELRINVPDSIIDLTPRQGPLDHNAAAYLLIPLGVTSLAAGDPDEALACANKAIELNKYELSAYYLKSNTYRALGEYQWALDVLGEGLIIAPDDDFLTGNYIIVARHYPVETRVNIDGMLDKLLARLQSAHEIWPNEPEIAYSLARKLEEIDDDDTARELLLVAHDGAPYFFSYALDLAFSLAAEGDLDEAINILSGYELEPNLHSIINLYSGARQTGSGYQLSLADWLRDEMDPENHFAEYVDPFAEAAREACGADMVVEPVETQ